MKTEKPVHLELDMAERFSVLLGSIFSIVFDEKYAKMSDEFIVNMVGKGVIASLSHQKCYEEVEVFADDLSVLSVRLLDAGSTLVTDLSNCNDTEALRAFLREQGRDV